jgi:UrcA family protein
MTMRSLRLVQLLAAAATAALLPLSGNAQGLDAPPRSITVKYSDLDVNTTGGAGALYARLARAARAVCTDYDDPIDIKWPTEQRECRAQALADAVVDVHRPMLTAVFLQHQSARRVAFNAHAQARRGG